MYAKVLTSFIAHFHKLTQKLCSNSTVNNLIMAMPSTTLRMLFSVISCVYLCLDVRTYEHASTSQSWEVFNSL